MDDIYVCGALVVVADRRFSLFGRYQVFFIDSAPSRLGYEKRLKIAAVMEQDITYEAVETARS